MANEVQKEKVTAAASLTILSEEETMFRESVRQFAEERIRPLVSKMDHDAVLDASLIQGCFDLSLMGINIPEAYGGAGSSFFMAVLAVEELSRIDPSLGVFVDVQNTLVNNAIIRWAREDQKRRYLTQLSACMVGAYALSEPSSGSDAFGLQCEARADGNYYVLNGRKLWITNANEAGLFIVFANANPGAGYKGITAFLVEKGLHGFTIGKKEDKLGIRASSTCELILEDCRIPKENVLGAVGQGYKVAIETLNEGRIGIGAQMVGLAQGALEYAIKYTKERRQFGKSISEFQGVQFQLAEMAVELEAARLMVYNAARLKDAGHSYVKEAAMAKIFSSDAAEMITSRTVELYGGYGYTRDYPVEKFYRDAKIGKIYEGTSNMQLQTIAKLILAR